MCNNKKTETRSALIPNTVNSLLRRVRISFGTSWRRVRISITSTMVKKSSFISFAVLHDPPPPMSGPCDTRMVVIPLLCFLGAGTDLSYYELILKKAAMLLSGVQLKLLKFALSLRSYSSTVHSFQQVRE